MSTDPLYEEAKKIVKEVGFGSVSSLQRRMRIDYCRAARLMEEMETSGFVSKPEDMTGKRRILPTAPEAQGGE